MLPDDSVSNLRHDDRLARARRSLDGLSVGDAFGECWFGARFIDRTKRRLPPGPWPWTDDTHMALSIFECMSAEQGIDPDALARRFARRFAEDPRRGYGSGALELLRGLVLGGDWRIDAPGLFGGSGSFGNGAAMRVAPLGAYFHDDPERAAAEARLSAAVTHAHPEGQAGAIAVAVAASHLAGGTTAAPEEFLLAVAQLVPEGETRNGILRALEFDPAVPGHAALELGCGNLVSAQDTVPFCLWVVAHGRDDYAEAMWRCVDVGGDMDTTCAITGGLVALSAPGIPDQWLRLREPLPDAVGTPAGERS
jgi:ADP-ribosylglycohydrolase